tara:strand:- start:16013 stop:17212 length:1200 start_codon:yes stop_codon:yes gene_type:complete
MNLPVPLFDPQRLRVYPRLAVAIYVVAALAMIVSATAMIDVFGKPLGYDFITFWGASHLTLSGEPLVAFDFARILQAEQLAVPANTQVFLWHYPPVYQMLVAPLALLPYGLSWLVFVGAGLALYVATVRPLFADGFASKSDVVFLLLAFPGAFICVFHGQNSLYSAAIFAGGLLLLERGQPYLAGLVLGLLIYKPQLGLLLPLAFLVSGQWRVLIATGLSAVAICGLSAVLLGPELWLTFIANAPIVREVMEQGMLPWAKMPSAFVFLVDLGVPLSVAYGAQMLVALAAAAAVALVWRRHGPTRLSWAVLIAATLLVPPYTFDYEFAILAPVLVILVNDMGRRGATLQERVGLVILYVLPLTVAPFAQATHLQIGFPLLVLALVMVTRRALSLSSPAPL